MNHSEPGLNSRVDTIASLPAIKISSGSLEALKWIALLSMAIDHANRFFFNAGIYQAYCIGRIAMPLFALIFAYNLSQPGALEKGLYFKVFKRLTLFGILATPGYIAMRHLQHLWPLNIMFMLLIAAACLYLYEKKGFLNIVLAIFLFLVGGLFVEYSWQGLIFCIASWFYCKKPSVFSLAACLVAYLLLNNLNGNNWALLSLALIFLATQVELKIPRTPYFFYIFYPAHLSLFYLFTRWIA